ncbi:MAG TPA: hypothetical protein VF082_09770 [Jiangellaceae bacterium]
MATMHDPGFPAPERAAESAPPQRPGLGAGRVTVIVFGAIGALLGLGLTTAGVIALVYEAAQRDADGFVLAPDESVSTETYAITSEGVDIYLEGVPDWVVNAESLGTIRVNAVSEGGEELFVGIAPEAEVDAFLADVPHEEFTGLGGPGTAIAGDTEAGRPDGVDIWVASATSTDTATVTWSMEDGRWALVVMNADASPDVAVDLTVGARIDWLDELGIGLLVAGVLLLGVGVLAIALAARTPRVDR